MSEGVRTDKGLPGGDIAQRLRGHYVTGLGARRDFSPFVQPICIEAAEEIERLREFFSSVACYFAEGTEFMDKVQLYNAFKAEFHKYLDGGAGTVRSECIMAKRGNTVLLKTLVDLIIKYDDPVFHKGGYKLDGGDSPELDGAICVLREAGIVKATRDDLFLDMGELEAREKLYFGGD